MSVPPSKANIIMHPAIERIRSALKQESFTSGTCKVPVEHCDLYYESSTPESFVIFLDLHKLAVD